MRTFKGVRPLGGMVPRLEGLGYSVDTTRYDAGSDYIDACSVERSVAVSAFNGRFSVFAGGEVVATESSGELDGEGWYSDLLDAIYEPMEVASP